MLRKQLMLLIALGLSILFLRCSHGTRIAQLEKQIEKTENYGERLARLEERFYQVEDKIADLHERSLIEAGMGIVLPVDVTDQIEQAKCHANQRILEGAVAVYMADHGGSLPDSLQQLVEDKWIRKVPVCPTDSSSYKYDKSNGSVTCHLHPKEY